MSTLGSYPTRTFKESQKFLVLDPDTQSASLVSGRDLVEYITPQSTYVFAEQSRAVAQNEDYQLGALIQTAGDLTAGDNFAGTFLVVPGGDGDFPMANGNDLLIIKGDVLLREQLASNAPGEGSDLVVYTGTSDTVTETLDRHAAAIDKRTIYVGSVAELEALSLAEGTAVYLTQEGRSGKFLVKAGVPPSDPQQGIYIVLANGNYAERLVEGDINLMWFGATGDGITDDTDSIQAAEDYRASVFKALIIPAGEYVYSYITLQGDGKWLGVGGPSLKSSALAEYTSNYRITGSNDFAFEGITFDGNKSEVLPNRDTVLYFPAGRLSVISCLFKNTITQAIETHVNSVIRDCIFEEAAPHSGTAGETSLYILVRGDGNHVEILSNDFSAPDTIAAGRFPGGIFVSGASPRVTVENNTFTNIGQLETSNYIGCVDLYTNGNESIVKNNYCIGSRYQSIKLQNSATVVCTGNIIKDPDSPVADINFQPEVRGNGILKGVATISDNLIINGKGISVQGSPLFQTYGVTISNNVIFNPKDFDYAIGLTNIAGEVILSGNIVTEFHKAGVLIQDCSGDIIIDNCKITSSISTDTALFARTGVASTNIQSNNSIYGSLGTPVFTIRDAAQVKLNGVRCSGNFDILGITDELSVTGCSAEGISRTVTATGVITEFANSWNGSVLYASAIPTTGSYPKGTIVYNTAPGAGSFIGWVNLGTSNSPIWRTWGAITP